MKLALTTPTTLTDGYKIDHRRQYMPETTEVLANMTPRKSRVPGIKRIVVFGIQYYILATLLEIWNKDFFEADFESIAEDFMTEMEEYTLSKETAAAIGVEHWRALHKLGYLPLEIKALPEGTFCPIKVPCYTVRNTHRDFYWLTNFIETDMSSETWGMMTSATLASQYRKIFTKWAKRTGGDLSFIPFQGHNFSYRGMLGRMAAVLVDMGHSTSFLGSDTIPGRKYLKKYYRANQKEGIITCSVFATEHAVMCTTTGFFIKKNNLSWERYGDAEFEVFKRLITEVYPSGNVSIVSDTWSVWMVLTDYIVRLKDVILARDGKVIFRPDSGNPADIVCGLKNVCVLTGRDTDGFEIRDYDGLDEFYLKHDTNPEWLLWNNRLFKYALPDGNPGYRKNPLNSYPEHKFETPALKGVVELLWDVFGGSENEKGFKVLHPSVGVIYGDSITLDRAEEICSRLAEKRFCSTSWVAGIGSFTYQHPTRDTFGFAQKATYAEAEINGEIVGIEIFKDPVTDDGEKKSARGIVGVFRNADGELYLKDRLTKEEERYSLLQTVFINGKFIRETSLEEIRALIRHETEHYENVDKILIEA